MSPAAIAVARRAFSCAAIAGGGESRKATRNVRAAEGAGCYFAALSVSRNSESEAKS